MPFHVFVDETKARGFLMAAARCPSDDVSVNRKILRELLLPGQERLHFRHETDGRRRQILATIEHLHLLVDIYQFDVETPMSRAHCLEAIVRDTLGEAERRVIERDESTLPRDRSTLHAACQRNGFYRLRWDLLAPKLDPLLWVPDAVAWAWAKGGHWRRSVARFSQLREP
ncbi:hypothetical protein [Kribbella sp. NPDC055071]